MVNKTLFSFFFILLLSGCSIIPANKIHSKAAEKVHISTINANKSCHYVGEVYGDQGNWFTGMFTSNINIVNGSINNLKNQAAENNADYIYLENSSTSNESVIQSFSFFLIHPFALLSGVYNVSLIGQAYSCNNQNKDGEMSEK